MKNIYIQELTGKPVSPFCPSSPLKKYDVKTMFLFGFESFINVLESNFRIKAQRYLLPFFFVESQVSSISTCFKKF